LIREGTQLSDAQHSFHYDIAPACSGIRSLIALLALTTIYGFISFKSTWRRLLMILSAVPLAVIGNVVRLTFTVVVAEAFGQDWGSKVEQKFGFVTFAVAIALVVLIGNWLQEEKAKRPLPLEARPA
jgi:exosortase